MFNVVGMGIRGAFYHVQIGYTLSSCTETPFAAELEICLVPLASSLADGVRSATSPGDSHNAQKRPEHHKDER